jgi:ankyrin repeat protein
VKRHVDHFSETSFRVIFHNEMIELLIDNEYDLNENYHRNIDNAIAYDLSEYLELLIKKEIIFKEIDKNGWTCLHWAACYNAYNCAKVLKKYTELNSETKNLYERERYVNRKDSLFKYQHGLLPIDIARINNSLETLKVLKE